MDVEAELYQHDFARVSRKAAKPVAEKDGDPSHWLAKHENKLEKDAPEIQEAARLIGGQSDLDQVKNILAFLKKAVKPSGYTRDDRGALGTLRQKKGDCGDYSDLFVALCRAGASPQGPATATSSHRWPGETRRTTRGRRFI